MKKSVHAVFSALIEQTQQRGGCPSVREISDASIVCDTLVACWSEVRLHITTQGISTNLIKAIEAMDKAVVQYEGE